MVVYSRLHTPFALFCTRFCLPLDTHFGPGQDSSFGCHDRRWLLKNPKNLRSFVSLISPRPWKERAGGVVARKTLGSSKVKVPSPSYAWFVKTFRRQLRLQLLLLLVALLLPLVVFLRSLFCQVYDFHSQSFSPEHNMVPTCKLLRRCFLASLRPWSFGRAAYFRRDLWYPGHMEQLTGYGLWFTGQHTPYLRNIKRWHSKISQWGRVIYRLVDKDRSVSDDKRSISKS